jgi:hypothetical protein
MLPANLGQPRLIRRWGLDVLTMPPTIADDVAGCRSTGTKPTAAGKILDADQPSPRGRLSGWSAPRFGQRGSGGVVFARTPGHFSIDRYAAFFSPSVDGRTLYPRYPSSPKSTRFLRKYMCLLAATCKSWRAAIRWVCFLI